MRLLPIGLLLYFLLPVIMHAQTESSPTITGANVSQLELVAQFGRGSVTSLALAEAGSRLAIGGETGLRVYDLTTSKQRSADWFTGHPVENIQFGMNGTLLAYRSNEINLIRITDDLKFEHITTITPAQTFVLGNKYLVFESHEGISLFHLTTEERVTLPASATSTDVHRMAFSRNETHLLIATDTSVRIWNTDPLELVAQYYTIDNLDASDVVGFNNNGEPVTINLAYEQSYDQADLFEGSIPGADNPEIIFNLDGEGLIAGDISSDGQFFVAASGRYSVTPTSVRLFDLMTGEQLARISTSSQVQTIAISPDSQKLAITTYDGQIRIYATEQLLQERELNYQHPPAITLDGFYRPASGLVFSPNSETLVTSVSGPALEGSIYLWDVSSRILQNIVSTPGDMINALTVHASSDSLIAGGRTHGAPSDWYHPVGQIDFANPGWTPVANTDYPIIDMKISASGEHVLIVTTDTLEIWSLKPIEQIAVYDTFATDGEWVSDDRVIAGTEDGQIVTWDWKTEEARVHPVGYDRVADIAVASNGNFLAITGENHIVEILKPDSLERISIYESPDPTTSVHQILFHPSNELLVARTESDDGTYTLLFINSITGDTFASIQVFTYPMNIVFNEAGSLLAMSGTDGIIRMWGLPAQ